MTDTQNIVNDFKQHLEKLGFQQGTVHMLPVCVREFLEVQNMNQKRLQHCNTRALQHHLNHLQTRPNHRREGGLSEAMIAHHMYALKTFFQWLVETHQIKANPVASLRLKSPVNKVREILSKAEILHVYDACENPRETALLSLAYGCGLRRSEIHKLDITDVHLSTGILYVRHGKNNKRRAVPMGKKVMQTLLEWLKTRPETPKENAFMLGKMGGRMSGEDLNRCLKSLLERAGIQKQISLHSLRHSIATHLLENGLSIHYVRDFLGHKHLETTQRYTKVSHQLTVIS